MRIKGKRLFPMMLAFVICASSIAGAVLTVPVFALTLSAGGLQSTIASIVISLMLQAGVAPVNNTWVNTLNNAYGVESSIGTIQDCITNGLLTETAEGLMDTGLSSAISSSSAYTQLGLDEIFITTAEDAGVIANSAAINLTNTAINAGTLGTIGAFAGAAAVGVGVGIIARNIIDKIGDNIRLGIDIDQTFPYDSSYVSGGVFSYITNLGGRPIRTYAVGTQYSNIYYAMAGNSSLRILNNGTDSARLNYQYKDNEGQYGNSGYKDIPAGTLSSINGGYVRTFHSTSFKYFSTTNEADNYLNGILNGTIIPDPIVSPDVIGPNGNQYYDNVNENYPGVGNIIPEGGDMNPVDMDDYLQFLSDANNNTQNGDIGQDQADLFDDFVSPYITVDPVDPEPEQPVPDTPNRPNIPEQPTIPDKPTITEPEIEESLGGATPDLKDVFPFCIPFDIFAILTVFKVENRKAPVVSFTFIDGNNITLDLSRFDTVAALLRTLELIAFIVGLAVATRKLIGAT